ncbi:hypothetical protein CTAYLR_009382 [Chrysophaeum taylorii]|uniref:Uncharacterized protein n=1 Tax=Chrysophaeum taylorii TaxID=2483200 RepID=A0AAD7UJV3_9STRA|nr:hypothetical protein CTAYLR_009382 [Chrysophaeum taylorii]
MRSKEAPPMVPRFSAAPARKTLVRSASMGPLSFVGGAASPPSDAVASAKRQRALLRSFRLEPATKPCLAGSGAPIIFAVALDAILEDATTSLTWFRGEPERDVVAVAGGTASDAELSKTPIIDTRTGKFWAKPWYATSADDVGARLYARCTPASAGVPKWASIGPFAPTKDLYKSVEAALRARELVVDVSFDLASYELSSGGLVEDDASRRRKRARVEVTLNHKGAQIKSLNADSPRGLELIAWDRDVDISILRRGSGDASDDGSFEVDFVVRPSTMAPRLLRWWGAAGGDLWRVVVVDSIFESHAVHRYAATLLKDVSDGHAADQGAATCGQPPPAAVALRFCFESGPVRDVFALVARALTHAACAPFVRCVRAELVNLCKDDPDALNEIDSSLRDHASRELELLARIRLEQSTKRGESLPPSSTFDDFVPDDPLLHLPWEVDLHAERPATRRTCVTMCASLAAQVHASAVDNKFDDDDDDDDDDEEDEEDETDNNNNKARRRSSLTPSTLIASPVTPAIAPRHSDDPVVERAPLAALRSELKARQRADDAAAAELAAAKATAALATAEAATRVQDRADAREAATACAAALAAAQTAWELSRLSTQVRRDESTRKSLKAELATRLHEQEGLVRINRELRERVMLAEEEAEAFKNALEHHILTPKETILSTPLPPRIASEPRLTRAQRVRQSISSMTAFGGSKRSSASMPPSTMQSVQKLHVLRHVQQLSTKGYLRHSDAQVKWLSSCSWYSTTSEDRRPLCNANQLVAL